MANTLQTFYGAVFDDREVNGELFRGLGSGCQEEDLETLYTYIPQAAQIPPGVTFPLPQCQNANAKLAFVRLVYACNYFMLRNTPSAYNANPVICARIAFVKSMLVRDGYIDTQAAAQAKHCRYTLVHDFPYAAATTRLASQADIAACVLATRGSSDQTLTDAEVDAYIQANAGAEIVAHALGNLEMAVWRKQLPDLLCLAAWIFRTRGHHYKAEFEETIRRVWKATSHSNDSDTVALSWNLLFRECFKSVFPVDLEEAYGRFVKAGICSGNLVKKYASYPAGSAAFGAVLKGYEDLITVFPVLRPRFVTYEAVLSDVREIASAPDRRMELSINARYYGKDRVVKDESSLSAIAAVIVSALKTFGKDSPLLNSPSLKRLSSSAPITGGVIGGILDTLASSAKYQETVLKIAE